MKPHWQDPRNTAIDALIMIVSGTLLAWVLIEWACQ